MNLTRVYVANMDRLPRTILERLMQATGSIEVLDEATSGSLTSHLSEVFREVSECKPDVVIIGVNDSKEFEAFADLATTRVMLLKTLGEETYCYQLRPERKELGSITPGQLISIVKSENAVRNQRT